MRSAQEALAHALAEVTYPTVWSNGRAYTQCLRAVTDWYQFLGSGYQNANDMWNASTQRHSPSETPPLGAPGFWGGGPNGDTRLYAGNGLWRGTNLSASDIRCVTLTTAEVTRQSGNAYYGWISAFGSNPISFESSTTSALDTEPIVEKKKRTPKMLLSVDTEKNGWLNTENGCIMLTDPRLQTLFRRLINSDQEQNIPVEFNQVEQGLMNQQLQLIQLQARTGVDIDPVKLAALIAANMPTVELDDDAYIAALNTAFSAAIPQIARAVNNEAAARLAQ